MPSTIAGRSAPRSCWWASIPNAGPFGGGFGDDRTEAHNHDVPDGYRRTGDDGLVESGNVHRMARNAPTANKRERRKHVQQVGARTTRLGDEVEDIGPAERAGTAAGSSISTMWAS